MLRRPKPTLTQSKLAAGEGQLLGVALHRGSAAPRVEQPVAAAREHRPLMSVIQTSPRADAAANARARSPLPEATSSTRSPGRTRATRHGERLPQAVQAERHQVVHQVVALGDAVEDLLARAWPSRLPARARSRNRFVVSQRLAPALRQPVEIFRPQALLVLAELVQVVPGIDAGRVAVGECRLHGIRSDRLERTYFHLAFCRPAALPAPGRGRAPPPRENARAGIRRAA